MRSDPGMPSAEFAQTVINHVHSSLRQMNGDHKPTEALAILRVTATNAVAASLLAIADEMRAAHEKEVARD